jgi:hypothetical protein
LALSDQFESEFVSSAHLLSLLLLSSTTMRGTENPGVANWGVRAPELLLLPHLTTPPRFTSQYRADEGNWGVGFGFGVVLFPPSFYIPLPSAPLRPDPSVPRLGSQVTRSPPNPYTCMVGSMYLGRYVRTRAVRSNLASRSERGWDDPTGNVDRKNNNNNIGIGAFFVFYFLFFSFRLK